MGDRIRTFSRTRRGFILVGALILLGIWAFNYFLNSIWSMLIIVSILAVVGWIQYFAERRQERKLQRG